MSSAEVIRLEDLEAPGHSEWQRLGDEIDRAFLDTLRSLTDEEWATPTECAPWTIKDVVAHMIGWGEAVVSPSSLTRQASAGWRTRSFHGGSWLDATNQFQVDKLTGASPAEVLGRFAELTPRFHRTRARYGLMTRMLPMKEPFSGTWVPVRFLFDTIFVRDHFMHHIDICTALGRPVPVGAAERRVAHDVFREWARKTRASVRLDLAGPAGGVLVAGAGATRIAGDAIDLCRKLAGRHPGPFEVDGDRQAADRWLEVMAAF